MEVIGISRVEHWPRIQIEEVCYSSLTTRGLRKWEILNQLDIQLHPQIMNIILSQPQSITTATTTIRTL